MVTRSVSPLSCAMKNLAKHANVGKVNIRKSEVSSSGVITRNNKMLGRQAVIKAKSDNIQESQLKQLTQSQKKHKKLQRIRDHLLQYHEDSPAFEQVLNGTAQFHNTSYAGGEFGDMHTWWSSIKTTLSAARYISYNLMLELLSSYLFIGRAKDCRDRKIRTEKCNQAFAAQLSTMKKAYIDQSASLGKRGLQEGSLAEPMGTFQSYTRVRVVDLFSKPQFFFTQYCHVLYSQCLQPQAWKILKTARVISILLP